MLLSRMTSLSKLTKGFQCLALAAVAVVMGANSILAEESPEPPEVGDKFPTITATSMDEEEIDTEEMLKEGPLVVSFIRGFPGYQCPLCTRQVAGMVAKADELDEMNARVILIYPGAVDSLGEKASEFFSEIELPKPFKVIVDKDYEIVNAFGLRWDAKRETVYPSTFVVNKEGEVSYALISKGHGGRAKMADVLEALAE